MSISTLSRWDPFRELEEVRGRLSNILGRSSYKENSGDGGKESMTVAEWSPLVDIIENDKEYVIKLELPEIPKDAVKVTVENGVLLVSGERKFTKEEKNQRYHRIERTYGNFARSFALPDDADPEKVNAVFTDGVLKVHVTKSESARPKQIEVKVS